MNLKKALKHDVEVAGKTIPTMIIAALFLVGGGSAALLSSFGTVSGTADVDQSVTFSGGDTVKATSFNNTLVTAGTSSTTPFTLDNDAGREATVTLDSGASEIEGISQVVKMESYDVQNFDVVAYDEDSLDTSGTDVEVDPNEESVTYTVNILGTDFVGNNNQASQLYFTHPDFSSTQHVYVETDDGGTSWSYGYKNQSTDNVYTSESNLVSEEAPIQSMSYDESSNVLSVTVDRPEGFDQSFAFVDAYGGDHTVATVNWATGDRSSVDQFFTDALHESIDYDTRNFDNPVAVTDAGMATGSETNEQVSLEPNSQTDFKVTTDFHVALDPQPASGEPSTDDGDYLVDLEVVPKSATP